MKYLNILFLAFTIAFTVVPTQQVEAQTVMDRISKRFFKKNKLKKYGKRLTRTGGTPLEEMALEPQYEVVGFEPSWMIASGEFENHYFNLLSTLVIGEYDINPTTGATRNRESLRIHLDKKLRDKTAKEEFNIIQAADYHNSKINFLLQLTYYGDYGREANQRAYVSDLIKNDDVHRTLKDSLQAYFLEIDEKYGIIEDRQGILLDFQIDNIAYNEDFVDFIKYLRAELGDSRLIYMKIPSKVRKDALIPVSIIQSLEPYIDRFIVQAYGFEKFSKPNYSPMAVFDKTTSYSVDGTLTNYMLPGYEDVIREKFIFEIPYYGVIFKRDENNNYFLKEGSPYITIDNFNRDVKGRSGALKYKNGNTMAYYLEGDSLAYLVEDSTSLVSKYKYLVDTLELNGFAINALGYYSKPDEKRAEQWAGIADNFGEEREKLGWIIAYYLAAFLPIGFVFSVMRYWEVRNALAKFNNYWTRFRVFFLLSLLVFVVCTGVGGARILLLILGLIIMAAFLIYIVIKKLIMRSKKYVNIVK